VSDLQTSNDIELPADGPLEAGIGIVQTAAWASMAGVIVLALMGVFGGGGPYSKSSVTAGDLTVTYDRFVRRDGPMEYQFALRRPGTEPAIEMSNSLVEGTLIQSVTPEPRAMARGSKDVVFTFQPPPGDLLRVSVRGTARSFGSRSGALRAGQDEIRLSQFVYP
jgi:hypothetical protein